MKKIILLTTGILLLSCSNEELAEDQNLIDDIELLSNENELNSDKESAQTTKDTDNDGINDEADVDTDNDGIEDNGTDIDEDGINDEYDDYIDGDGISNEEDEYQNLSDTDLSSTIQQKITAYINENHSGETITEVEIENQIIEVELSGNIELSFDLNGDFLATEAENDHDNDDDNDHDNDDNENDDNENEYSSLSSSNLSQAVQKKIADYISANYPNDSVTEVEIENQKIEVELSSGIELIFDLNGNFLRLDD
ncbi:MAG: PepSY-like domain-containing protein [Flavobacteriaceae bacterium]